MNPSRSIVVRALSGCVAAFGPPESRTCLTFNAAPMLFSAGAGTTALATLSQTDGQLLVINQTSREVQVGDVLHAVQDISGYWCILETGQFGTSVKFRANTKVVDRAFQAVSMLGVPQDMVIRDRHNLWNTITPGCIGTAYRDSEGDWEVETCSLPANEIVAIVDETIRSTTSSGTATVASSFYLRSTYPNVMKPPEIGDCDGACVYRWISSTGWFVYAPCENGCDCPGPPPPPVIPSTGDPIVADVAIPCSSSEQYIDFENPWKLDAMCGSKVILRRVTDAAWGDTIGVDTTGSAVNVRWELVAAELRKARWISFDYDETSPVTINQHYEGEDPSSCGEIQVEYPLGEPCEGSKVFAFYNPNSDRYVAVASKSAMLGDHEEANLPIGAYPTDCGIKFTSHNFKVYPVDCDAFDSDPEETPITLGTLTPMIYGVGTGECGKISYGIQQVRVFMCDDEGIPTLPEVDDFPINLGPAKFLTGAAFGGNNYCGTTTWRFFSSVGHWVQVGSCPGGCTSEPPDYTPSTEGAQYTWSGGIWILTTSCPGDGVPQSAPDRDGAFDGEVVDVDCVYEEVVDCEQSAGSQCGLNLTFSTLQQICDNEGSSTPPPGNEVHVPLQLQAVNVVQEVYEGSDAIVVERATIYVCSWNAEPEELIPLEPCPVEPDPGSGS
jgi:hypothetical protein